jgi:regulator of sigma E protease
MDILIKTGQLLLALSILVALHEGGHFVAARIFKIRVERFYLFFDFLFPLPNVMKFSLFKIKRGDTEYGIGWFPMGGYVSISGMVDENMNTEQLALPPQPWEFRSKPAWQRLIVMMGGIIVNLMLGIGIFWALSYHLGENRLPLSEMKYGIHAGKIAEDVGFKDGDHVIGINGEPKKYWDEVMDVKNIINEETIYDVKRGEEVLHLKMPTTLMNSLSGDDLINQFISDRFRFTVMAVEPGEPAAKAGLLAQDQIVAVNGISASLFDQFQRELANNISKEVKLTVVRGGKEISIPCQVGEDGRVGIQIEGIKDYKLDHRDYGLFEALAVGTSESMEKLKLNAIGLSKIVTGKVSASKSVRGPIGMANLFGAHWDWLKFWSLTGLLSLVLAFMNFLPIPALDGGHVVFLLWEMITGKAASQKVLERAQIAGTVIILGLMILVFGNDIYKLFK